MSVSKIKLDVSCSMESLLFYVISLNEGSLHAVNFKQIKDLTYMKDIILTEIDPNDYANT